MKIALLSLVFALVAENVQACPPGAAKAPPAAVITTLAESGPMALGTRPVSVTLSPAAFAQAPVVSYAAWSSTTTGSAGPAFGAEASGRVGLREKHLSRKLARVQKRHGR